MKKSMLFGAVASLVLLASCGSTKTAVGTSTTSAVEGTLIAKTPCEEYAELEPSTRFAASGDSWDMTRSRQAAEAAARNFFASAVASSCSNAYMSGGADYTKTATTEEATKRVTDGNDVTNSFFLSKSKETINDAVVVKSDRYKLPNGNYRTWVCIEYRQGIFKLASNMADKVEQQIPDDERLKMKYDRDKFIEQVMADMEKSK